jgi:hypothetical protein
MGNKRMTTITLNDVVYVDKMTLIERLGFGLAYLRKCVKEGCPEIIVSGKKFYDPKVVEQWLLHRSETVLR